MTINNVDAPTAPGNLAVTTLDTSPTSAGTEVFNLTWALNRSRCMVLYQIEVSTSNSFICENTTSQYTILLLNFDIKYSLRVRAIDKINRIGNGTEFTYTPTSGARGK